MFQLKIYNQFSCTCVIACVCVCGGWGHRFVLVFVCVWISTTVISPQQVISFLALMFQTVWESAQQSEGQLFQTAVIHLDLQSPLIITTGQTGTRKCLSIRVT